MSYMMDWELTASNMNYDRAKSLIDLLDLEIPYDCIDMHLLDNGDFFCSWCTDTYGESESVKESIADLCKQWPDVLFELYSRGETDEAPMKTEFENGKMRDFETVVTYELHDEVTL